MENNIDKNNELPFTVIEFRIRGLTYVSVAPKSWILTDGSCYWPPTKVERKAIMKQFTPEDDWTKIHKITVLGEYATYKEANFNEKRKAKTETESETNEDLENVRKRAIKKNKTYLDGACSPPPQVFDDDASLSADADSESEISNPPDQITNLCSGLKLISDAELISLTKEHIFQDPQDLPAGAEEVENYTIEVLNENISENAPARTPTSSASEAQNRDFTTLIDIMLRVQETMRIVDLRLGNIEEKLNTNPPSSDEECVLPNLPIHDVAGLKNMEVILNEDKAQKQLFQILRFIGGSNEKNCVNRCLQKVFSNYLAMFCSWTGKKGNFQLSHLTTMRIIKDVVKTNFPNFSEEKFEKCVMAWFQFAKVRHDREMQKKETN